MPSLLPQPRELCHSNVSTTVGNKRQLLERLFGILGLRWDLSSPTMSHVPSRQAAALNFCSKPRHIGPEFVEVPRQAVRLKAKLPPEQSSALLICQLSSIQLPMLSRKSLRFKHKAVCRYREFGRRHKNRLTPKEHGC